VWWVSPSCRHSAAGPPLGTAPPWLQPSVVKPPHGHSAGECPRTRFVAAPLRFPPCPAPKKAARFIRILCHRSVTSLTLDELENLLCLAHILCSLRSGVCPYRNSSRGILDPARISGFDPGPSSAPTNEAHFRIGRLGSAWSCDCLSWWKQATWHAIYATVAGDSQSE